MKLIVDKLDTYFTPNTLNDIYMHEYTKYTNA